MITLKSAAGLILGLALTGGCDDCVDMVITYGHKNF